MKILELSYYNFHFFILQIIEILAVVYPKKSLLSLSKYYETFHSTSMDEWKLEATVLLCQIPVLVQPLLITI
jgi:hypothetical protein